MLIFVPNTECIDTSGTNDPDHDTLPVDDPEYVRGLRGTVSAGHVPGHLPVLCLPVLSRSHAGNFFENTAEIVPAAEGELLGNLLSGHLRGFKQEFCLFDLCAHDVVRDAHAGFFFKFCCEIIFTVADPGCQVSCFYFLIAVQLNVIDALPDLRGIFRPHFRFMNAADEVRVHGVGERVQIGKIMCGFGRLHIAVSQRVGFFR